MPFTTPTFTDPDVLFVMATPSEYGPHLRQMIDPLILGIGPVEAAVTLTATLAGWQATGQPLPDLVVSLGSAGSRTLRQTEVYQVSALSYRDMDLSVIGYERGRNPRLDHPAEVALPHRIPAVPCATLSTGADMVSGAAYDSIPAEMVDMETFAVWRVCDRFGLPLIGLRGISDGQADLRCVQDWAEYLHVIDEKLAVVLTQMEQAFGGWRPRRMGAAG